MKYNRDSTLMDKDRYYRGWPKESLVSYYDPQERKRMKEMTPSNTVRKKDTIIFP